MLTNNSISVSSKFQQAHSSEDSRAIYRVKFYFITYIQDAFVYKCNKLLSTDLFLKYDDDYNDDDVINATTN